MFSPAIYLVRSGDQGFRPFRLAPVIFEMIVDSSRIPDWHWRAWDAFPWQQVNLGDRLGAAHRPIPPPPPDPQGEARLVPPPPPYPDPADHVSYTEHERIDPGTARGGN